MKKISMAKSLEGKTLQEGYKEFITHCKVKNLSEKTIIYYDAYFNKFEAFLKEIGVTEIGEVTPAIIDRYTLHLKELDTVNDISINTALRAVRAFVYYWQGLGYCKSYKIHLIKADKKIKKTYTENELKLLLQKPDMKTANFTEYRNWVIVNFLLATGVRVGELVGIQINDIDMEEAIVKVERGKSRRERHLPLSNTIIKILMEYHGVRGEGEYLFCNSYGQRMVRIPDYPDGYSEYIRTVNRQHPDTLSMV